MTYKPGASTAPGQGQPFPTTSYMADLYNTGGAGVAPVLWRRGPTPGSPAQAQMAQQTGSAGTQYEQSLTETIHHFGSLSPQELIDYQHKLYSGGFYDSAYYSAHPKQPDYGVYDIPTLTAWSRAANLAAELRPTNMTFDEILTQGAGVGSALGGGGGGGGGGGRTRAPLQVTLTNPVDITHVVNQTVQQLLGRHATQNEINTVTSKFQAAERAAQTQNYNTNISGGTATQAPNLTAFTEQEVQSEHPNEVAGHEIGAQFDNLLNMLKSPV